MEYKSSNSGLLSPAMIKTGDKLIILEPAYSTFNEARQTTYWNAKVQLPDSTHKLAGLFESACDQFAAKWGGETNGWVGHTILCTIKVAKSGSDYIQMSPTDDAVVDVTPPEVEGETQINQAPKKDYLKTIEYPTEEISPEDIPF